MHIPMRRCRPLLPRAEYGPARFRGPCDSRSSFSNLNVSPQAPYFPPQPHLHQVHLQPHVQPHLPPHYFYPPQPLPPTTGFMATTPDEHKYDQYQRPDDIYQPNTSGPAIGVLIPTEDLVEEYKDADLNFQAKTKNINLSYSYLRKCRGDGDCGWRAIAFGYFESLLRAGNGTVIAKEMERLKEIDQQVVALGVFPSSYLDTDSTYELMDLLQTWIQLPNRIQLLVDYFNDEAPGESRVFHFRLMACTAVKRDPDQFINYLPDMSVEEYCNQMLVPAFEIDEPAIQALFNILLDPAGIILEILDLNRSPGGDIYTHSRTPSTIAGEDGIIRLLYRPGHYDLIYKMPCVKRESPESEIIPVSSDFPGSHAPQPDIKYAGKSQQPAHQSLQGNIAATQLPKNSGFSGPQYMVGSQPLLNAPSHIIHFCPGCHTSRTPSLDINNEVNFNQMNLQGTPITRRLYGIPGKAEFEPYGISGEIPFVDPEVSSSLFGFRNAQLNPTFHRSFPEGLSTNPYPDYVPSPPASPSVAYGKEMSTVEEPAWFSLDDRGPLILPPCDLTPKCVPAPPNSPVVRRNSFFEDSFASWRNPTDIFETINKTPADRKELLEKGPPKKPSARGARDSRRKAMKIRKGRD